MTRPAALRPVLWQLGLVAVAVLLLEGAVRGGWVNPFFLAPPTLAGQVLWAELVTGRVLGLVLVTVAEIGVALLAAVSVGLVAGFLLWRYRALGAAYEPLLGAIFASPIILLYPVALVIFGRTSAAVVVVSAVFGLIPVALNTRTAFAHVSPVLVRVGSSMSLSRRQMFRHILVPAAAPTVFSGFRLSLTYILKSVLGLEYVIQVGGLGRWVSDAAYRFAIPEVYAGVLGTLLLSVLFVVAINRGERWVRG
jgi:NitT/TauT family transport system permease protein